MNPIANLNGEGDIVCTHSDAMCAFTVDVEDWYQSSIDFDAPISDCVVQNVERVIELLDECKVKGTFFVQGLVAQKFPELVQRLAAAGHEIQSHGHTHRPLYEMNRSILRRELEDARKSVEDASGIAVTSFRAPDFSILSENLWALDVLAECGFTIDSSIFPICTGRYGIRGWQCSPQRVTLRNGGSILEAPVAVLEWLKIRIPIAGGGYFRLLPIDFLVRAIRQMMTQQRPVIIYCHPYEFNSSELEKYRGKVPSHFLYTQGLGRRHFVERMRRLLKTFRFCRLDELLQRNEGRTSVLAAA